MQWGPHMCLWVEAGSLRLALMPSPAMAKAITISRDTRQENSTGRKQFALGIPAEVHHFPANILVPLHEPQPYLCGVSAPQYI